MRWVIASGLLAFVVCGCDDDEGGRLLVDLRTDLLPVQEFIGVRLVARAPDGTEIARVDHVPDDGNDYVAGVRVAEVLLGSSGDLVVDTTLVALSGRDLIDRRTRVDFSGGAVGITVVITRDCLDVECADVAAPVCLGSLCVADGCTPERPEECGTPACTSDADCTPPVACATGICDATGACVFRGDDAMCSAGLVCVPDVGCEPGSDAWWDPDWTRRRRISFLNASRDEALTDFVVYIEVADDQLEGTRFVDADGSPLAHEEEPYETTWAGRAWVRVPEIAAATDDDYMWLYYGNPSAGPPGPAEDVWSDRYQAVWHLGPGLLDSTRYGWDLMDMGTTDQTGWHNHGRVFDDSIAAQLRTANDTSSMSVSTWTLSGWAFRVEPPTRFESIVTRPHSTFDSANDFYLGYVDDQPFGEVTATDGRHIMARGDASPTMTWEHLAATFDGARITVYRDGERLADVPWTEPLMGGSEPVFIGVDTSVVGQTMGGTDRFDGQLDEIRIESGARSDLWLNAQHASAIGTLLVVGPEQR